MNDDTLFLPGLSPVGRHDIHARFDGGALSSDGGVLLLREIERGMNFSAMLAITLRERPVQHSVNDSSEWVAAVPTPGDPAACKLKHNI